MKRYFSLLLALGAMLACCVFASAEETACSPWAELYLSDAEQVYDIIPGELQDCHWQAPIPRQEAAAFLFRAAEYCGLQTFSCDLPFSDSDEIAPLGSGGGRPYLRHGRDERHGQWHLRPGRPLHLGTGRGHGHPPDGKLPLSQ